MQSFRSEIENPLVEKDILELERKIRLFKEGKIDILVATDIAARGLDIEQLPQVVNFDLPNIAEDYIHRIGRTGRAGQSGTAISLVCNDEFDDLKGIERLLQKLITRKEMVGFEPTRALPESSLDTRPIKAKRSRKPKKPNSNGPKLEKVEHKDGQLSMGSNQARKKNNSSFIEKNSQYRKKPKA